MRRSLSALAFILALPGCAAGSRQASVMPLAVPAGPAAARAPESHGLGAGKIKHVVIIIQENRTLDNLFNGFPGADTAQAGRTHDGRTVALHPQSFVGPYDPDHEHSAWLTDYDGGKMDGFDVPPTTPSPAPPDYAYAFVPQTETVPYWDLAKQYTLADRMFASETGPSFPGHQYLIAGQSDRIIGNPNDPFFRWGCDAAPGTTTPQLRSDGSVNPNGPFPCFDYLTLADLLDAHGLSWKYYTNTEEKTFGAGVQPYDAIRHIRYGADWQSNVVAPQTQILQDIAGNSLPAVSWVNPPLIASDHAQSSTNFGPEWVATIVNAIGNGPQWNETAVLVTWDDWGGWYDHVAPPQLDLMGLSFRVPLLVISPYAKRGYVSHVQHEFGSLLKFTERTFRLGSLGTTDARADALADFFDFSAPPRPFTPIALKVPPSFFANLPPNAHPIDY